MHVGCGVHVVEAGTPVAPLPAEPVEPAPGAEAAEHLLALSWQPAFCETRPGKAECRQLNAGELPVTETQLSVHGLWPQPEGNVYCGVPAGARRARQGVAVGRPAGARRSTTTPARRSRVAMPGTASFLERHEWIKHGTCHRGAGGADEYFDDTLALADAVNASRGRGACSPTHVGAEIETAELRAAFDAAFGAGAGDARAGALHRRRRPHAGPGAHDQPRGVIAPEATPAR